MNYQAKLSIILDYTLRSVIPETLKTKIIESVVTNNIINYQFRHNILADTDGIYIHLHTKDFELNIDGFNFAADTFIEFIDTTCPNLWYATREQFLKNFVTLENQLLFLFNFTVLDKDKMMDFLNRKQKSMRFYEFLLYCGAHESDAKTIDLYRQEYPNEHESIKEIVEDQKLFFYNHKAMETRSRSIKISELIEFEMI